MNKVLEINPKHEAAAEAIKKLQQEQDFQFERNPPAIYQTNSNSIASLITGILGWVFGIVTVFVGFAVSSSDNQIFIWIPLVLATLCWFISIITGFTGLKQINNDNSQKGDGFAKSGIIMSGIGCVFPLCFILLTIYSMYVVLSTF